MLSDKSLAEKILDEMSVRYAKDGLKVSDVVDLSDDEDGEELSDAEDADLWDQHGPYAGL